MKKLKESGFHIILNEDSKIDEKGVDVEIEFYEGKPVGFLLTNPKTKNEDSPFLFEKVLYICKTK